VPSALDVGHQKFEWVAGGPKRGVPKRALHDEGDHRLRRDGPTASTEGKKGGMADGSLGGRAGVAGRGFV